MRFVRNLAAAAMLCSALAQAGAAVINFNSYTPLYDYSSPVISTDGFFFTSTCDCLGVEDRAPESVGGQQLPGAYNRTASLIYREDPLTITAVGGAAFYLDSLELGLSWYVPDADVGSLVTVAYVLAAGGNGSVDAALGRSYTTLAVGQDVLSVTISGGRSFGYVSLDNMVVNNVPEPESAALALVALLGAGAARRCRRA
ncbi:PEP-CTERM sorting domain-containing protein [Roseateles sp. DC23W]|uniref:PEP-CTERM sorting domain-containing protein n=1 Tax=Pelomonas dachongensis TaxID=3299029 RepID=A0ABW7EJX2_9BURK